MKLVFAIILICAIEWVCEATTFKNALDQDTNEVDENVLLVLQEALSLELDVFEYSNEISKTEEDDVKERLAETLRESLDKVLQKIWDAIEHGRQVSKDLTDKAKEISDKLKELGLEIGNKAHQLLKRIRSRASDLLKKLLERIGVGKRSERSLGGNTIPIQFQTDSLWREVEETLDDVKHLKSLKVDDTDNLFSIILEKDRLEKKSHSDLDKLFTISQNHPDILNFTTWLREILTVGFEQARDRIESLRAVASKIAKESEIEYEETILDVLKVLLELRDF